MQNRMMRMTKPHYHKSNALRGSRELATFLEFCRVKVIRIVSIHDQIDSRNELFPETTPSDVLEMMGALPEEVLALRKSAEHVVNFTGKDDSVTTSRLVSKDAEARQRKNCHQPVCCRSSN